MATRRWLGHAADVAQKDTITVGGAWLQGETVTLTIASIDLVVTIGTLVTVAQVAKTIKQAINSETPSDAAASVSPPGGGTVIAQFNEFAATVDAGVVTVTAKTAGVPFALTATTNSAGGTVVEATATAATGKNFWSNQDNWTDDAVPAGGDDAFVDDGSVDILYALDQSAVTLASLNVSQQYGGKIGLPVRNANGYSEYRGTYLKISATAVNIGTGAGAGSGRIKLDTGANAAALIVSATGKSVESGLESFLWKGTHASNSLNAADGSVGVAVLPGEAANLSGGLKVGRANQQVRFGGGGASTGASVRCGGSVTLATVTKDAGTLTTDGNVTTLNSYGGETVCRSGDVTTATVGAGSTVRYLGGGTISTAEVSGHLDFSQVEKARTVTTAKLYRGGTIRDPAKSVTFANGILLAQCDVQDVNLILGPNRTLTPS